MFEVGLAFFAGLIWWEILAFAVFSIFIVGTLVHERAGVAIVLLTVMLFWGWSGTGPVLTLSSLLDMSFFLLGYLLIGILWSFKKWRDKVSYAIKEFKTESEVRYHLDSTYHMDNKLYWVTFWPFSLIGFLFGDLIEQLIERFKGAYAYITNKMIADALKTNNLRKDTADRE